jgi:hypothetical protein
VTREPEGDKSSREDGLRWLARNNTAPELNLQHALQQPYDPAKSVAYDGDAESSRWGGGIHAHWYEARPTGHGALATDPR